MLERPARHPFRFIKRGIACGLTVAGAALDAIYLWSIGSTSKPERNQWLMRWSARAVRSLNIRVRVHGSPPSGGMVVANHLSYLDILALASTTPATFLSKAEVRTWPIVGYLTQFAGTLYVRRKRKRDVHDLAQAFSNAWKEGTLIVMFPEGTSSNGERLLPFHASLFKPACDEHQTIAPACIRYACEGGTLSEDVHFWRDMAFLPHVARMLTVRTITVDITFGTPRHADQTDRKTLACLLWDDVQQLRLKGAD